MSGGDLVGGGGEVHVRVLSSHAHAHDVVELGGCCGEEGEGEVEEGGCTLGFGGRRGGVCEDGGEVCGKWCWGGCGGHFRG